MYSIYTRSLVISACLFQTTPAVYACPSLPPPASFSLLAHHSAVLRQGAGASLLPLSAILSAASPSTCLKALRLSSFSKPQSPSGQLVWQPCQPGQPSATFLPRQPEVGAREGHTSLQALRAKHRSTKIRFPLREASPGQLKPSPPHWAQWGHWINL